MYINSVDILAAIDKLTGTFQDIQSSSIQNTNLVNPTFSTVSGLDDAGLTHSTILDKDAIASQKAFADRFANASNTLSTNLADFIDGDQAIAGTLSSLGVKHPIGDKLSSLRSSGPARNTDTLPFHASLPMVARPSSLIALCGQFAATNFAIPAGMTTDWTSLASTITAAAASLDGVLADLHSSAETDAISQAIANITTLRNTGLAFASNASLMAGHTTGLGTGSLGLGQQTASVGATYQALMVVRPDAAALLEQTYLNAFPGMATAALAPSIPAISQLLPGMNDPSGASAQIGGAAQRVPEPAELPLPPSVAAAMNEMGYSTAARMSNPQSLADEFLRTGPEQLEQVLAGQAPTTTATTGVAMPPTLNPGGQGLPGALPNASGATNPAASMTGASAFPGTLPQGASNSAGPAASMARGQGMQPFGNLGQASSPFGAGNGANSASRSNPIGRGLGAVANRAPNSAIRGSGTNSSGANSSGPHGAFGTPRPGFFGSPSTAFGSGHAPGNGSNTGQFSNVNNPHAGPGNGSPGASAHSNHPSNHTTNQHTNQNSRGMVPAGMAQAGRNGGGPKSTAGAVKKVTSAVEREGNLKALLGPGPEVVPGVIGAWVREPKR
ncbi:hypothetical protein ACXZ66_05610 [Corynebacterium sp. S7]